MRQDTPGPAFHEAPPFDWRRYLVMARTQAGACCALVLAVSLCAFAVAYLFPKKYEASSTVSIEQNVISDLVKGIAVTPSVDAKLRILKVSLLSRKMLLDVTSALDMDLNVKTPVEQENFLESLRNSVQIVHDEKKGLFFISFTDRNPVRARDFVNTLTRKYIEGSTASKRTESFEATSFLADQIEVFQKRREKAQEAIDAFRVEKGMYLGLNEHSLREQIRETELQLDALRIQKTERQAKLALMTANSPQRKALEERERALQSLLASYTERHPAVVRAREDIKLLKQAVEDDEKGDGERKNNLDYQTLLVELQSLEGREKALEAVIDKNKRYLQELPEIRTELAALEQAKLNENAIYQQLVSRYGQSEVSKQMELQDKAVNFHIIDAAVLPTAYISPNRPLIIVGGIMAGVLAAGLYLVAQDLLRGRIRSRADLEKMRLEILATLPTTDEAGEPATHGIPWELALLTAAVLTALCLAAVTEYFRLPYIESAFRTLVAWI